MKNKDLKVLIVDDEYLIRNFLKLRIKWKNYGMKIVGEASNTREALDMVDEYMPDIIFTDICMPYIDGIEFSEIVLKRYANIKVVIITGHKKFEYAKRSIKVGIYDFILKPIDENDIEELLLELKSKIEIEKSQESEMENLKSIMGVVQNEQTENQIISEIKDYIRNYIDDPDISLTSVAKKFYISPSHLSRLFKQCCSITFIGFVTKVRIEKVIKLLNETDLKVYEIADLVGVDPHYLSIIFKKNVGTSINKYKKKMS